MAIALALLAIILPIQFYQASTLGGLSEKVSAIDKRLEGIDKRLDGMEKALGGISDRLSSVDGDPTRYIASAGIIAADLFSVIKVGGEGRPYIFPKSERAKSLLEASGLKMEAVAPGIFAFPAPQSWMTFMPASAK